MRMGDFFASYVHQNGSMRDSALIPKLSPGGMSGHREPSRRIAV